MFVFVKPNEVELMLLVHVAFVYFQEIILQNGFSKINFNINISQTKHLYDITSKIISIALVSTEIKPLKCM